MIKRNLSLMCFVIVLLNSHFSKAQVNQKQKAGLDSNNIKQLALLAEKCRFNKPDSAIWYAEKSINAGTATGYKKYIPDCYNSIGMAYYVKGNYKKAISSFQEYYNTAKKLNDLVKMAFAINNEGNVYIELGDYSTALDKYQQALALRQTAKNAAGIAMSYNNIGFVYKDIGEFEKAISYFLFSLREFEKLDDKKAVASVYNSLSIIYTRQKKYDVAIDYNRKALDIQKSLKDLSGIGVSLQGLANLYALQLDYSKAIDTYNEAIKNYNINNDVRQLSVVYSNLGEMYSRKKEFAKAITYFERALEERSKINNRRNITNNFLGLASAYLGNGNMLQGKVFIDSAWVLIAKSNNKIDLQNYYDVLADYHTKKGNFEQALESYKKYTEAKDTLFNIANIKSIAELQTRYETEKKELKINILSKADSIKSLQIASQQFALTEADLQMANDSLKIKNQNEIILQDKLDSVQKEEHIINLNKQARIQELELNNQKLEVTRRNIIITVITVLAAMVVLLGYSFYRRYKLQQQTRLQHEILKQQDLATKAVLAAEETERRRIATDLHDGVGQLMSAAKMNLSAIESDLKFTDESQKQAYDKAMALVDEGCKEVRAVSHNMMPNALLRAGLASAVREFLDNLSSRVLKINLYTDGLNERIDSNTETILYRVIQECVNNVIKHAKASLLDISIVKENENISVTIEDNGTGFDKKIMQTGTGIGLKNIETRMAFLKGSVEWESEPGKGTLVVLHVKS